MRYVVTLAVAIGCIASHAAAFQSGAGTPTSQACELLTRDLAMRVSTTSGKKVLESAKPSDNIEGMAIPKGASVCDYGRITLVLDPFARPDQVQSAMRARSGPYKNHEPVPGVGDAAFFQSDSAFANLYVWTGSRQFHVQMGAGFDDQAAALKANAIALAQALIPLLR